MVGGVSFNDESNMAPEICIHLSTGTEEEKEPATFFLKKGAVMTGSWEKHAEEKKHVKIQHVERFKLFIWNYSKDLEEEDAETDYFPQQNKALLSTVQSGNGSKVHPHNTELEQHKSNNRVSYPRKTWQI